MGRDGRLSLWCVRVACCHTLRVFLLGVVGQRGGHGEAHVTVFAAVRFLPRVQPHVVLQGRVGSELGAAFVTHVRPFLQMLSAPVVQQTCNTTANLKYPTAHSPIQDQFFDPSSSAIGMSAN